ncbi:MAG TPA: cytochrome c biogenesis protein CcsA [Rhodanobacteraceae bacterium]|jgi:ABC-type uncharacterized transport system permease subunit|nr:cytochrome c biogenesis protein CcsA [Rhodanobacteraceae bacterium]
MPGWSILLAVVAYIVAATCLVLPLIDRPAPPRPIALGIAAIAVALHFMIALGLHQGGINLHFFAALSLVGLVVAMLALIVNVFRPVAGLGVVAFPLAALLLAIGTWFAPPTAPLPIEWQIKLHVAFALLGYGMLSVAALLAILLALQERALRNHRLDSGLIRALPPLTSTETLMFRLIGAGFVLLTLTLLSGVLFVDNLFAQHLVQKTVLSIAAWIVFGILLFGRWRWGWRGRRAVRLTLAGMAILLLAFFGSKFVLEVLLNGTA